MKMRLLLLGIPSIIIISCTAQKFVVEEMTLTDQGRFTELKTGPISVSTHDSVDVRIRNQGTDEVFKRKRIILEQPVRNYEFSADSLFIYDSYFSSVLGLKTISKIKFRGIFDDGLGFVSEEEINDNISSGNNWIGGIAGALAGGGIGILVGSNIATQRTGFMAGFGEKMQNSAIAGCIGALMGAVLGWNVLAPAPDLQEILNEIRIKRKIQE